MPLSDESGLAISPNELRGAETEMAGLPISSTLNAPATKMTRSNPFSNPEFLGLMVAGIGDMLAAGFGHKPTALATTMQLGEARRKGAAEQRLVVTEERKAKTAEEELVLKKQGFTLDTLKYRMDVGKFIASKNKDDIETVGRFLDYGKKLKDQGVSPDVAEAALRGVAEQSGLEFLKPLAPALAKNLDLTAELGPMYQLIKDEPGAALFLMNANEAIQKNPSEFFDRISQFSSRVAARRIVERLPATVAALKEASGGQPITLESVAKAMSVDSPYMGTVLRGAANMTEDVRKVIEQVLTTHGVQTPAVGAKVAEAKALIPVKAEEAKAVEEATRVGREKFAADVEKIKQGMAEGAFPNKEKQADLRNQYRSQGRQFVEAQYRGPMGQITFITEKGGPTLEQKFEDKAVEMANADGMGLIFPTKKPAAPKPVTLKGQKTDRPDGTYKLPDGTTVTVKGGIIQ